MTKTLTHLALAAALLAPLAARAQDATALLRDIKSEDAAVRAAAVERASGPAAVAPLISLLYGPDAGAQPAVVTALRRLVTLPVDPAQRRAIADALLREAQATSQTPARRAAAMEYLSFIADDSHVPAVAALLMDSAVGESARFVLMRMPSHAAGDALAAALPKAEPAGQAALISALAQRGDARFAVTVAPFVTAARADVRLAAIAAVGRLGGADAATTLWNLHTKAASEPERQAAFDAYLHLADRLPNRATLYTRLYNEAKTPQERIAGLAGIIRTGGASAVAPLLAALRSDDADLRGTAANGLALLGEGTPLAESVASTIAASLRGATPAQRATLLEILARKDAPAARAALSASVKDPDPAVRTTAWNGVRASAGMMSRATLLSLYHEGLPAAATDEERNAILAGIETMAAPESLPVLRAALARGTSRTPILAAMMPIGATLASASKREEAIAVFRETLTNPGSARIARESAAALRRLGVPTESSARFGYIANWWVLGPLPDRVPWKTQDALPVEGVPDLTAKTTVGNSALSWKFTVVDDPGGMLDLNATIERRSNTGAYAYAEVTSSSERNVVLKIGSDDDVVVWLNGKKIHEFIGDRAWVQDQESVPARLSAGANRFLVKVLNGGADWGVSVRITDPSGTPLNLKQRTADTPK